ncbi:Ig-like domain-containing protein [Methanobrevibacter sp.]|uniref:Ig-like domain-containing protein n=1 Tax=Methanobrevibacter sp. TaxID=66852 RepID=UPI00388EF57F
MSAAQNENETLETILQPDPSEDLCKVSVESDVEKLRTENNPEKLSATQKATKKKITMNAPNVKMYYKDGSKFTVTLKYQKMLIGNAKVKINIDGNTYTKTTDKKGTASINLNLKSGTYTVLSTCDGNSEFASVSAKSTVTIKSTVKCSDYSKYYKNTGKYTATFYDKKGKVLKNTAIKFKINSKTYTVKTDSKGVAKLAIDLKPNKYTISVTNSKTSESISKTVTIKSLIVTNDLTFKEGKKGKFNVKILNSNGKVEANKKVTIKVNGKTYSKITNKNGIATLELSLNPGSYSITTQYSGLKSTNMVTVTKIIKPSSFTHTLLIPSYVNVTTTQVYDNSVYTVKSGFNGIIKMPKNEIFTIQVGDSSYQFSNIPMSGVYSKVIGYYYHLIPFDGSEVKSSTDKSNLKGNGIVISRVNGFTQIDYQSSTSDNVELFGFYADKGLGSSETFTYMQNDKITAKVNVETQSFDELGLQYSIAKFYQKSIYDFNYKSYDEITNHNTALIKFVNTNTPVSFSYFGKSIVGDIPQENIITRFSVNGVEELEKRESITYGFSEKYRKTVGFEVLQSYSIVTEKINRETLEHWINYNNLYLNRFGVMNAYGMHLASLETIWLADKTADEYSKKFNVTWSRTRPTTILGGINLEDTYLNVLNADMGMDVEGKENDAVEFRLINSLQLPNIEEYCLDDISARFLDLTTNSQDNIFFAINNNKFSIAQLGEMMYLFAEDGSNSAIVLNTTNGVASVIHSHDDATYKGASVSTVCDCCSIGMIPTDIISGIRQTFNIFAPVESFVSSALEKIHPLSKIAYKILTNAGTKILTGAAKAGLKLLGMTVFIQQLGSDYREDSVDPKDWYDLMDTATFTRPGYLQGKKIYNIPNGKDGYDYVEVKINKDLSLDRNNVVYISHGKTRNLTKQETYEYFTDEYWTPINVPTKYWDESWRVVT